MDSQATGELALGPNLRRELAALWKETIHWDADMGKYCTFRTGGRAEALLDAGSIADLSALMPWLAQNGIPWKVIGRGSNILVRSKGFRGIIIRLGGEFRSLGLVGETGSGKDARVVRAGAACSVGRLVEWCCRHGIGGIEFMVGIPGSIGGAVSMNAGAWGGEIGDRIDSVSYIDRHGIRHVVGKDDLIFSYRHLSLREGNLVDGIITGALLRLQAGHPEEIAARCRKYNALRKEKQPLDVASAGSFFRNPPGDSAGRLIDEAGLKGLRRGNAMVSIKHGNFIVNTGQATADDIVELMREVQEKVYLHSGVMLEPEVKVL